MAHLSDYSENKLLDHLLGTAAFTMPSQVYVALYTTATTDAGGGTEVAAGDYAREPVDFAAASGGTASPTADVEFAEAIASWGTVTHIALRDALTGGNSLMHGPLAASKAIDIGDAFRMTAADLDAALA